MNASMKIPMTFPLRLALLALLLPHLGFAQTESLSLTLPQAEKRALTTSPRLKASFSDAEGAVEFAEAQYTSMLPKLSLEANYQHLGTVPTLATGPVRTPLTTNSSYGIGPVLRYNLWDTGAARQNYKSFSLLALSRLEERKSVQNGLLANLRLAYLRVQLNLEELRLVSGSLELAKAQGKDVSNRFRAGASSRLDLVSSQRSVLNFDLQFKQKQAELTTSLRDLFSLMGEEKFTDLAHPGPEGIQPVTLVIKTDPLKVSASHENANSIPPPDQGQPQIKSLHLQAEAAELAAEGMKAKLYPTLQLIAAASLAYPNGPTPERINQTAVGVSLTLPLFLGDTNRPLAAQKLKDAEATRFREDQLNSDIQRDFAKGSDMLQSLYTQKTLAAQDVLQSEEVASLFYSSYKAGRNNLVDVQNANNQALQAKVTAARIDAQILSQIITLRSLSGQNGLSGQSGKDPFHDSQN